MLSLKSAIHTLASTDMNTQFRYALAYRFAITQISCLELTQPCGDSNFGYPVAKVAKPVGKGLSSIFALITDNFDHGMIVA